MRPEARGRIDWRDAAAYARLRDADRAAFAWEWLRRDPDYVAAACRAEGAGEAGEGWARARAFGLVAFEPPGLAVPDARPMWAAGAYPFVLEVEPCGPALPADAFALSALHGFVRRLGRDGTDHLLLSDGLRGLRLDAPPGTFDGAPLCLRYRIHGLASAEPALRTLTMFLDLCRTGRFARSLHPPQARALRWILMLRAWDGIAAGADHRAIAEQLFSRSASGPRWRAREPSVRSRAQRLVRSAEAMAGGGYRSLLR